ncbi:MAG: crossover junction endodeoxyribonuclease RuvC [Calditrichaceae bacterium]|jgi:crossover junction endodeoxyribonuclease RuvC
MSSLTILGVDPGITNTGYGIVKITADNKPQLFKYGHFHTNSKHSLAQRLHKIYSGLEKIIAEVRPDIMVVENIFYSENVQTAIIMGHARGAILIAGMNSGCEIAEYSPREVKQSVVGTGGAAKEQVHYMVKQLLDTREDIRPDDASDALAAALCHWHKLKFNQLTK